MKMCKFVHRSFCQGLGTGVIGLPVDPGVLELEMVTLMEEKGNLSLRVTTRTAAEWMNLMNGSQV